MRWSPHSMATPFLKSFAIADWKACSLPIQFGGATQAGRRTDHNNQDAIGFWARDTCFVGVTCDGCGSSKFGSTNTEVGARLTAAIVAPVVGGYCLQFGVAGLPENLEAIEREILNRLVAVADAIGGERQVVVHSLLMTTVLCLAMDREKYCIFGCGDGAYIVDGKMTSLKDEEGKYLAEAILAKTCDTSTDCSAGALRVHVIAKSQEIQSLVIATDGLEEVASRFQKEFDNFLALPGKPAEPSHWDSGLVEDFRRRLLGTPTFRSWEEMQDHHDDRSFIAVKVIPSLHVASQNEEPGQTEVERGAELGVGVSTAEPGAGSSAPIASSDRLPFGDELC